MQVQSHSSIIPLVLVSPHSIMWCTTSISTQLILQQWLTVIPTYQNYIILLPSGYTRIPTVRTLTFSIRFGMIQPTYQPIENVRVRPLTTSLYEGAWLLLNYRGTLLGALLGILPHIVSHRTRPCRNLRLLLLSPPLPEPHIGREHILLHKSARIWQQCPISF